MTTRLQRATAAFTDALKLTTAQVRQMNRAMTSIGLSKNQRNKLAIMRIIGKA